MLIKSLKVLQIQPFPIFPTFVPCIGLTRTHIYTLMLLMQIAKK
jgi:hypothetical protein